MARLLRLLPDPASPHEPRSVDPSKIAFVSLAAVANRAKPLQRTTPSWHIEVQCGGGGRLAHGPLANVRTPVGPTGAAQQLFRLARSSPNLRARPSLTRSNRRGTDPYARWCGRGGAARHPPIPIKGYYHILRSETIPVRRRTDRTASTPERLSPSKRRLSLGRLRPAVTLASARSPDFGRIRSFSLTRTAAPRSLARPWDSRTAGSISRDIALVSGRAPPGDAVKT